MREMKDSGIEWIGQVPNNWKLKKGKYLFKQHNNRGNLKCLQLLSPSQKFGVIPQTLLEELTTQNVVKVSEKANLNDFKTVHVGDFCISLRSFQGGFEYSHYEGVVSPAYQVFSAIGDNLCDGYYRYLFKDKSFIDKMNSYTMTLRDGKNIAFDDFGNTYIPVPPKSEQEKIAGFLDSQCSEIDAISADIQKEIETLEQYKRSVITEAVTKGLNPDAETKKSAIFYMAPYNSDWRLSKIAYECTKLARPFSPADMPLLCTNKGKVSPRPSDMTGKMVSEDNAMQGIHKGDIVIHGMDTWHGAIAMSEYDGKITRVVHVCDSKQDKRFIVYYLQQLAFNDVYKLISFGIRGNTSDFRSWDKVKDIYIALPDIDEQQKISDFLDLECRRVEDIVSEKKKQLDVLGAYKKSLIYEYVTGKKEVPLWKSNT